MVKQAYKDFDSVPDYVHLILKGKFGRKAKEVAEKASTNWNGEIPIDLTTCGLVRHELYRAGFDAIADRMKWSPGD